MQVLLAQHGCPGPPHAAHWVPTQLTADAVQTLPGEQHACPPPPQVPQLPFAQVPPTPGQTDPLPVQMLLIQQPPAPHVLAAQQASPGPPQWVHTPAPFPVQMSVASQALPAQQAWPGPPHA